MRRQQAHPGGNGTGEHDDGGGATRVITTFRRGQWGPGTSA